MDTVRTVTVQTLVPVSYVTDLDRSRDFFRLFGYTEQMSGADGDSRWCYLRSGDTYLLLADVRPALPAVDVPLTYYLYVDDLAGLVERLTAAGVRTESTGYPDHAPGGEVRLTDPDGNTIVVGQRAPGADGTGDGEGPAVPAGDAGHRFSLLHEAAEVIRRRGGAPAQCQIGEVTGGPCTRPAEVKLADSWGETAWACLTHADETLIAARGAFLATQDDQGLGPFLQARRSTG